jgi:hypothetical protein
VDGTGSGSYPVAGFGISGVEPLVSAISVLFRLLSLRHIPGLPSPQNVIRSINWTEEGRRT